MASYCNCFDQIVVWVKLQPYNGGFKVYSENHRLSASITQHALFLLLPGLIFQNIVTEESKPTC